MMKKAVLLVCLLFSLAHYIQATHIRAGEIVAERISTSTLAYKFSVYAYTDTGSDVQFGGDGRINFGDGNTQDASEGVLNPPSGNPVDLGDEVAFNILEFTHTFQAPGVYTIRYSEVNRNEGIVNMINSVNTPFYVENVLVIDPTVGINNSPIFLIPPIDRGAVSAAFLHNPGAYDPDGDSLSYRITIPKQFFNRDVDGYRDPNDAGFYDNFGQGNQQGDAEPIFSIDPITGTLTWDAPGTMGEYNVAFVVDEWRQVDGEWVVIGSMTRDMQIIVEDSDNDPPEVEAPMDTCVLAGTTVEGVFVGTDPNDHNVELVAFGEPFQLSPNPATQQVTGNFTFSPPPVNLTVSWDTECNNVRQSPYQIQVRARDDPEFGPRLSDFAVWSITVVAPAPEGLTSTLLPARQVELNWDDYSCDGISDALRDSLVMQVWRRIDSYDINAVGCEVGMPAGAGYTLLEELDIDDTQYIDEGDGGTGLTPGTTFCYRLVVRFPDGAESYVSEEVCEEMEIDKAVLLNVDIEETDPDNGEVYVRWEEPLDLDVVQFPRPFTYDLVRIHTGDTVARGIPEKEFTDTNLDTEFVTLSYSVITYDSTGTAIDPSDIAESIRLSATTGATSITLSWRGQTPWSIAHPDFPIHEVYRAVDDGFGVSAFVKIADVNVFTSGLQYTDDGTHDGQALVEDVTYYYYVSTQGSYGNSRLPEPLINKSQIIQAQINTEEETCLPTEFMVANLSTEDCLAAVSALPCGGPYSLSLTWEPSNERICENSIESYNIYFSEQEPADSTVLIPLLANVEASAGEFIHGDRSSLKGYYQIASVDTDGNVGVRSDYLIVDNCPKIDFPNSFSPNGDNVNDFFMPYFDELPSSTGSDPISSGYDDFELCHRFVKSIEFKVFDRSGGTLFTYDSRDITDGQQNSVNIYWNGKTDEGVSLDAGTYFYGATVEFDVFDPDKKTEKRKGWIQLIK